jgi:hypothetical protein
VKPRPGTAPAPSGAGRLAAVAPVLAVLLLGLAVVVGQHAVQSWGWTDQGSWIGSAATSLDGLAPTAAVVVGGFVAVLLGVWLVVTGLRPRTHRTVRLAGAPDVHLGLRDLARLASGAARTCDGVLAATSTATPRRVRVRVRAIAGDVREDVARAVAEQFVALDPPPRTTVTVEVKPS